MALFRGRAGRWRVELTVLGCSGSYAGPGGACSGYLLRAGGRSIWIDAGPGTLAALQEHVALAELDAVVLTHCHPDHWVELPVARNALRYVLGRSGVPVFGTAETRAMAEVVCGGPLEPTLDWTTLSDGDVAEVAGTRVTCSRTDHPVETLALRVDHGGRAFGFTADTGPGWSPAALGTGLDLLLCEASARPGDDAGPHLDATQAGAAGAEAGAARLVVTHLLPGVEPEGQRMAVAEAFGADVEVAAVGATFAV